MTAFDGASAKVSVFFDGDHPKPGLINVNLSDELDVYSPEELTPEEAIELATDLISAANIRLGEQGKRQWMLPIQFPGEPL